MLNNIYKLYFFFSDASMVIDEIIASFSFLKIRLPVAHFLKFYKIAPTIHTGLRTIFISCLFPEQHLLLPLSGTKNVE